jgi:hypothetical protein
MLVDDRPSAPALENSGMSSAGQRYQGRRKLFGPERAVPAVRELFWPTLSVLAQLVALSA